MIEVNNTTFTTINYYLSYVNIKLFFKKFRRKQIYSRDQRLMRVVDINGRHNATYSQGHMSGSASQRAGHLQRSIVLAAGSHLNCHESRRHELFCVMCGVNLDNKWI